MNWVICMEEGEGETEGLSYHGWLVIVAMVLVVMMPLR